MSLPCPKCDAVTAVIETRPGDDSSGPHIRRRRECANGHRFTTYEFAGTSKKGRGCPPAAARVGALSDQRIREKTVLDRIEGLLNELRRDREAGDVEVPG